MTTLLQLVQAPWAQALGWALLHFLWQGLVLGLLAWVLLALLRGASARTRYGVACGLLLLMAASPAATFLHLLPAQRAAAAADLAVIGPLPAAVAPATLGFRLERLLPWFLAGWALGVGVLTLRFLGSWAWVQRLRHRGAEPVPGEWHLVLSRLCRELRLARTVRLLRSTLVEVPTALGWLRPVILLPASALAGLSPDFLEAILAHELAHIRRGDFVVNLLQTFAEALLFFHPAAWWLSRQIRETREHCCDDAAAALLGDPLPLAQGLAALAALRRSLPCDPDPALAAARGNLMHRITRLFQPQPAPAPSLRGLAISGCTDRLRRYVGGLEFGY